METKIAILAMLFVYFQGTTQNLNWREMIGDPSANFFDVQANFYEEFGDEPGSKGSGWKQFKRWEYYYMQRIDEQGNLPEEGSVLAEIKAYIESHPEVKNYSAGTGNWTELGPRVKPANGTGQPNGNGRLNCIAFHPTDANTIYVGAASGGFWRSTDAGATWAKSIDGLVRLGVSSIVVDPVDPMIIYIGTGDRDANNVPGYGVWRSTDGGATWSAHNSGMGNRTVNELIMDPTNNQRLIAATSGGRIYRSTNGGASWTWAGVSSTCKDIAFHPTNPSIIYAAGSTVNRSTDGGASFTQITSGLSGASRFALAVSIDQPDWVYAVGGDGSGLVGVYRSTNSGANYSLRTNTPNILGYASTGGTGSQAWYDLVAAADPTDANSLFVGGINIWKSTNGGSSFSISAHWTGTGADDVHADHHVLEYSPFSNNIFNGNDGGIYETADNGTTWNELTSGLGIAQVYKLGVSQSAEGYVINGYQDNGTGVYQNGNWVTRIGGDGMECIIDPTDANYMYGALYYGDIRRTTNGGANFQTISTGISESGGWVTPYKLDPSNENTMLVGMKNVWRTTNVKGGVAWTQISNFGGSNNITDLAIAPSNGNTVYASRAGSNRFYRSTNAMGGGVTWTNLTGNLPFNSTPKDIEIDPADPTHLFIALGNGIYESTNSGASWTDYSGTLPNISLNTIVIDPASAVGAMYVGMDVGVYYRDNNQADWSLYATGLTNVEVTELEIYNNPSECKSKLYASTYGQGLWVSDLKDPGNVSPVACFRTGSQTVCQGSIVILEDISDYTPTAWTWNISPSTFTFANGTSANSQNPAVQFTAGGTYTVTLTATNAHGVDVETKPAYLTVSTADLPSAFGDDFESYALCATANNCGATACAMGGSLWRNLTNGSEDHIDWRIDENGTPSVGTGPSIDYTEGTGTGNYAYLEASGCYGRTAILESQCINLDQNYTFDMGYHMNGTTMGEVHLDIFAGGAWQEDIMPMISGNQGGAWNDMSVDLSAWTGQAVRMRVRGVTGTNYESDVAIDGIGFSSLSPLPVELIDFSATAMDGERVALNWSTASETNSDYFEVLRSKDMMSWAVVAEEDAAQQSNSELTYETWDHAPYSGVSYYRLKQVDIDGTAHFSKVEVVNFGNKLSVYPNPATDHLTLAGETIEQCSIELQNALGQSIIFNAQKEKNKVSLDVGHLPNGVYSLKVAYPNGDVTIERIVIR